MEQFLIKIGISKEVLEKYKVAKALEEINTESQDSLTALLSNNCTWAEIETDWDVTFNLRKNLINTSETTEEIINKWPQYKKPLGYKLIEMDFTKTKNVKSIETSFPDFLIKVIPLLQGKVKGINDLNLLSALKCRDNYNENSQATILFYLIHHILLPTSREVRMVNNKKVHVRFSVKDAQKSFILIGATAEEMEEKLKEQLNKQHSIQPLLLITGSLTNPTQIIIYFDGIKYKFFSVLRGIDILFAIVP